MIPWQHEMLTSFLLVMFKIQVLARDTNLKCINDWLQGFKYSPQDGFEDFSLYTSKCFVCWYLKKKLHYLLQYISPTSELADG